MIALFSATGNTRLAAKYLSSLTGHEPIVPLLTLDQSQVEGCQRIIWMFPIHAWSVPGAVEDVIRRLRFSPRTEQYMVATCGDDAGRADRIWARLIRTRGGSPTGAFTVIMPNTYVLLPGMDTDSPTLEAGKLAEAPARLRYIAKAIRHHMAMNDVKPGAVPGLKSGLLRSFFRHFLMSPKPFHAIADACVGCGGCAGVCPLGNITQAAKGAVPEWGDNCMTCLACYHRCPRHAVAYGNRTAHKGQYRAPASLPRCDDALTSQDADLRHGRHADGPEQ